MTVVSSYSLESAPCPWGWGWRRAALADASPAPSLADSAAAAAAVAPDGALSLQVPAASSWPGAPVEAEKCAHRSSANRKVSFKSPGELLQYLFCWDGLFSAHNMLLLHYLTVQTYLIFSVKMPSTVLTLRCSWSWAWCWRVNFSCCFWNSLMRSCFWICCCFWMRSSSCCSCLSHSPGSEPGPSILRSVRRSSGDKGSTLSSTSGFTSTEARKVDCRQRKREKQISLIAFYFYRFK